MPQNSYIWRPQSGPQKALVDCPYPEIFFGGARGGGKTDGVLGKWALKERLYGADFNAVMFRRTTVSSEDAISRSRQIFKPLGGVFNESRKIWTMPNGGKIGFSYLDSAGDAQEYQGRNLSDVWVEEVGQYPDPAAIDRLFGLLRSANGVPVQMILTGNPGGPGQHWIANRYQLVPFPEKPQVIERKLANGAIHRMAVIPSRITDNRILMNADPGYVDRLHMVGSEELVKAWLQGDWGAVEGAFFDCWDSEQHILQPFSIPEHWLRFRSGDWGTAKPFSIGWWCVVGEDTVMNGRFLPRGAIVRYREWYGCQKNKPNTGLKLSAAEVARQIAQLEAGESVAYGVLDDACFANTGGPTIAETMAENGVDWQPTGNKTRISRNGILGGWDLIRARLRGNADGHPMMFVFSNCRDFIRTVPVLQHDPLKPEDLDTEAEDHIADEARYACTSRPWVRSKNDQHLNVPQPPDIDRWISGDGSSWRL
ncbi:phage terminase large subunit [Microvirga sp. W0021]|uniref:Phage terminase large subunit n=1 Tax=Hohaiivirga grylli TaxID=3133970 RepID=A0ABV0BNL1_9HYPH